ncbi:hypothetical protein EJ04DRAFT_490900 [Polyplosphaeria fusca]|uniref:BTB domain-containing protein n=1 Tax=Polyplosphaeria fusca TaxID=682080 RepID=A0A9P4R0H6_9PLEO|nr:hypothetical protein EJ04DRAFT_490900 [Polyplosphaeria fusca]
MAMQRAATPDGDSALDLPHSDPLAWPLDTSSRQGPHVSLFSSSLPDSSDAASNTSQQPHAAAAAASSRPLSSLAGPSAMTRRTTARLKVSDEPSPIAQLTTRIPRAHKAADDPTTPVDSSRSEHRRSREYTTPAALSRLFAADTTMPSSRLPSYSDATGPLHMRASAESVPLPDHLYTRGLLEGRHSDITVIAFDQRYNLHRLILDRAPFFTSALSEPWIESQAREVTLHPEEMDLNITKAAFELAIKKLYGVDISNECDAEAIGLFATGCWLEMQDLVDMAIESILRQMSPETLALLIRLVTSNYYGRSGDRILESAKAMLSRNGWEMPLKYWDDMPGDVIRELVASDGFFVDSEWDRWVLAKRLLDRRLREAAVDAGLIEHGEKPIPKAPDSLRLMAVRFDAVYRQNSQTIAQFTSDDHGHWLSLYTNPDIERILVLLDEGIHYIHMEFEQLEFIRGARDVFGLPVIPEKVISNALWQQLALRQRVLNADELDQELELSKAAPEPATTTTNEPRPTSKGKHKMFHTPDAESDIDSGSWDGNGRPRKFWIPSSDCNIVLGNGADPVVTTSASFQRHANRLSASMQPEDAQWATDFASSPSTMANPNTRLDFATRPTSAGGSNAGQPRPIAYTEFPPFRFSAEFPNPRFLKEKKRVYSRTVSYAGSLWNIYIQKVRSAKNVQLGVYLHRAKERDGEEPVTSGSLSQQNVGSVDERIGQLEREMLLRSERRELRRANRVRVTDQNGEDDTSGSGGDPDGTLVSSDTRNPLFSTGSLSRRRSGHIGGHGILSRPNIIIRPSASRSQSMVMSPPMAEEATQSPIHPLTVYTTSDTESNDSDDDGPETVYPNPSLGVGALRNARLLNPTLPTYVDGRPTIKTYFKIYSPSKGGRMLSIYESAPDRFNFSQSWGWKSSTLMLDEVAMSGGGSDELSAEGLAQKRKSGEGKLRFMVVIGNL